MPTMLLGKSQFRITKDKKHHLHLKYRKILNKDCSGKLNR